MPRYIVERTFAGGLQIPATEAGSALCMEVVRANGEQAVTWIHSYVSEDKTKTYCVYDAPDPEAILAAAESNRLPIDAITPVVVLDPYFYR